MKYFAAGISWKFYNSTPTPKYVIFRGVARLFKMRGRQGGWGVSRGRGADRDSKWRLSIDLCTKCNFIWGQEGAEFLPGGRTPLVMLCFILLTCYVFCSEKNTISLLIHQNYPKDHLRLLHMMCFVEKRTLGTFFHKAHHVQKWKQWIAH